jgi:hypothetical protein
MSKERTQIYKSTVFIDYVEFMGLHCVLTIVDFNFDLVEK